MGRGGRSPSPNDDRSRSMNPQDPVGQAAMANEARQRGDDGWDDDYDDFQSDGVIVFDEPDDDNIFFGETSRGDTTLPYGYDWRNFKPFTKPKVSRSIWDEFSVPESFISPPRKTANIKWSKADGRYILTSSDEIPVVLYALFDKDDIRLHQIPDIKTFLIGFGYDVEIEWKLA